MVEVVRDLADARFLEPLVGSLCFQFRLIEFMRGWKVVDLELFFRDDQIFQRLELTLRH